MWTAGKFRIRDTQGDYFDVVGIVDETFLMGIYQMGNEQIAVTHIATGSRIGRPFGNIGQAMMFADEIRALADWTQPSPSGVTGHDINSARAKVLRELPI